MSGAGAGRNVGIVFDLDGTLVESAPAVRDIANAFMSECGLPLLDLAETRGYIGNGAGKFLERALRARDALDPATFDADLARFHVLYEEAPPEDNHPMPGASEALASLSAAGHRLALCTNKPLQPTLTLIAALGWTERLEVVIAGDSLAERKPHPAPLLEAARRLGCARTIYVGDSEVDEETAARAGLPFVLFTGGYRKRDISEMSYATSFDSFADLPGVIASMTAPTTVCAARI